MLVGFDTSDDACVYRIGDNTALIQTVDFFPPMVDDPYLFGQVAAANSLSDVYAMGGKPSHAMNLLCIPGCLGAEVAGEILRGGADKCVEAGCAVVGGHTINDDVPKYGLSVSGFVSLDRLLENGGAHAGDVLVLTKPIGSGVLSTALKGGIVTEADVAQMTRAMAELNEAPIRLSAGLTLHGCTDVTGFGLAGHACEMAEGAHTTFVLESHALPLFEGALDMAGMGLLPEGAYNNRNYFAGRVEVADDVPRALADLVWDPQTSGGLLVALPAGDAEALAARLAAEGRVGVAVGRVEPFDGAYVRITA